MKTKLASNYNPNTYWNDLCRAQGHTGWSDEVIYRYDQPLRLRAINKALSWSGIEVNENTSVLDVGCGIGDLILDFSKKGAKITGLDISDEAIKEAKRKLTKEGANVSFCTATLENTSFPPYSFDLVTSITVLQHIVEKRSLLTAVKNIVNSVKKGGHILILESSPYLEGGSKMMSSHMVLRTRTQYISAFENEGCELVNEIGIPQIGIKLLIGYRRIMEMPSLILKPVRQAISKKNAIHEATNNRSSIQRWLSRLDEAGQKIVLALSYPFDLLLLPFPKKYANLRILVFRKTSLRI